MVAIKTGAMDCFDVARERVNMCFYPHEKDNKLLQNLDTDGAWVMIHFPSQGRYTGIVESSYYVIGVDVYWGFDEFIATEHEDVIQQVSDFIYYAVNTLHATAISNTEPNYETHDHPARAMVSFQIEFPGGPCE